PKWWSGLAGMTRGQAGRLIGALRGDWRSKPATRLQKLFLRHRGAWRDGLTAGEAEDLIASIRGRATKMTAAQQVLEDQEGRRMPMETAAGAAEPRKDE